MSSYSELIKYEDELKEKHTGILRNMSHVELKKFNQGKYHSKLLKELEQKLPMNNDETQLIETAQCIVNALEREAASLIKSRTRESTSAKKVSALLSDTVIADLDTTLQMNASQGADATDPPDNACDDDGDNDSGDETENDCGLDTSITQLKQIVTSNNESTDTYKTSKSKQSDTDQSICVPTCKIKLTSKKQYDMTRCTLCMVWCHDKCVGLHKDEVIGVWFCPSCRDSQQVLHNDVTCLKSEVKTIKECTKSILTAINGLSTQLENSVGVIHDKITALSRQIKSNDTSMSDSIENLTDTTNTIKFTVEEKADNILNKTKAIFDKVKTQAGDCKHPNRPSNPILSDTGNQSHANVPTSKV